MPLIPPENGYLLKLGDVVNIGVDLPDMTFAEDLATVIRSENGELMMLLCGGGFPQHMQIIAGAKILISKGEGQTFSQFTARIITVETKGILKVGQLQRVVVNERRAHMRVDLPVPVNYYLPQNQNMADVIAEWERAKGFDGKYHEETGTLLAGRRHGVNLSGSGLRFKIHDCFSHGTFLHLKIAIPGEEPDHIHAVGSIVRTHELPAEINSHKHYATSISFRMIESNDRQKLTRHILDEQRKTVMKSSEPRL